MKENVKSVIVLTAICLVVAALLAVTNFYTAPIIEANKANAANESLTVVMPDAAGFEEIELPADAPATVQHIYKETSGLGYVALLSTTSQYSSGDMGITMGVGADGKICGVSLTSYFESKDFGQDTYPQTYVGQDSALGGVDTVAGVTYSSTAFKDAITDAFTVLLQVGDIQAGEKSEEQLIAEVMPLALPGCTDSLGNCLVTECDVPAGATAAYKANNGCGYVVLMPSDNGTVVCGINAFGKACAYNLDGSECTDSALLSTVEGMFAPLASESDEANITSLSKFYPAEEGNEITAIEGLGGFDCLTGAYTIVNGDETLYAFLSQPYGFGNTPLKLVMVLNENGEIVVYRSIGEIVLEAEYFGANPIASESDYKAQFTGKTASTFVPDDVLVAGATFTTAGSAKAATNAFEAFFKLVKEAA